MSIFSRVSLIFRMRASSAIDKLEDPTQTLDYAYSQQQELLRKVNRGLIEVAASRQQLEQQAGEALAGGREDLARLALERKQTALAELTGLESQVAEIASEQEKLTLAQRQLSRRVEEFRGHRTILTARHSAAEAQIQVNEALTFVSDDFADLGMAVGRAEEKIERLQARASAIDALIASGALMVPGVGGDMVQRELRDMAMGRAVDADLEALKQQLLQAEPATAPGDLDSGDSTEGGRQ